MNKKRTVKVFALMMVFCLLFSFSKPFPAVIAAETSALEEQKAELEKKLKETEEKLEKLGDESKETEEYIAALDEKISYLSKQYKLAKQEAENIEKRVTSLESNIKSNESELVSIKDEIKTLEHNIKTLNKEFSSTYDDYCKRIRAIYISGQSGSKLSFLLTSDGLSNLLTRYQMISAVSKQDGELLESVKDQTEKIMTVKTKLDEKNKKLISTQKELKTNEKNLKSERVSLLKKQEDMASRQAEIEKQQLDANKLLKELHNKTKKYGEFRDITQEELDEIDADIEAADKKYAPPPTTNTTTKKKTTTTTQKGDTTKPEDKTTTTTTKASSSKYIKLTYPCPKYTTITCAFGAYEGHSGCDFSTRGNVNQKIVAAESGTVILVKILEYSYGHYIVIRHDKTTSSGEPVYTLYAHNNDIIVSEGAYVKKGQQIAYSGTTGNSTGPHCHFEVRVGGSRQANAVNPEIYLP
ncbi:MAG: peptidoglycan DD-metalloendopeptidase family protein [Eubacterium sp.]|nr:peptidoglycan DD-metalloendopeptidase family protein [Eubacterium sp.]